jgi:GntR family transcriptional regulator
MTIERTVGTVAIHDQIADDLRARIASGEFKPGDSLPSVRVLQEKWGCSDGPVREAFSTLLAEGRITSSRGAPARVRVPPQRKSLMISFGPEAAQTQKDLALRSEGERTSVGAAELALGVPIGETDFSVSYERTLAEDELAQDFAVERGTELLRRTYRTAYKDTGKLALFSVSWIPVALVEGNPALLDPKNEPWPGGHWHQLYSVGIEIDRLENSIIAVQPTTPQRQDWGMDPGVPLLCLRSRSVDTDNRVVEVSVSTYPADRTAISYTHQLKRWKRQ